MVDTIVVGGEWVNVSIKSGSSTPRSENYSLESMRVDVCENGKATAFHAVAATNFLPFWGIFLGLGSSITRRNR